MKNFDLQAKNLCNLGWFEYNRTKTSFVEQRRHHAGAVVFSVANEIVLKTIYPLREMKLRDFLVCYKEIELCAEYKDKNITDQISDYHVQQQFAVQEDGQVPVDNLNDMLDWDKILYKLPSA